MPWIAVCVETGVILLSTIGAVYILRETTMFHVKQWGKDIVLQGVGRFTSPAKRAYNDLERLETAVFAWQWSGQNIMKEKNGKKARIFAVRPIKMRFIRVVSQNKWTNAVIKKMFHVKHSDDEPIGAEKIA